MEITPRLSRLQGGWACSCGVVEGCGDSPEDAYLDWLERFQYSGPDLPINFFYGGVNSPETDRRT